MDMRHVQITTGRDALGARIFYVIAYDISQLQCVTFSCGTDEMVAIRLRSAIRACAESIKCGTFETEAA